MTLITDLDAWRRVCLQAYHNLSRTTAVNMGDVDAVLVGGAAQAAALDTGTADGAARYGALLNRLSAAVGLTVEDVDAILTVCAGDAAPLIAQEGEVRSCAGAGIPCPSFDEVGLVVMAVCNCHERWQAWGNPYGDETCPVHGELVKASIRAGRMVSLSELGR